MKKIKIISVAFAKKEDNDILYESVSELQKVYDDVRGPSMLKMLEKRDGFVGFVKSKHFKDHYQTFVAVMSHQDEFELDEEYSSLEQPVKKKGKKRKSVKAKDEVETPKEKTLIMIDNEIDLLDSLVNCTYPEEFSKEAKKLSDEIGTDLNEITDRISDRDESAIEYHKSLSEKYNDLVQKI